VHVCVQHSTFFSALPLTGEGHVNVEARYNVVSYIATVVCERGYSISQLRSAGRAAACDALSYSESPPDVWKGRRWQLSQPHRVTSRSIRMLCYGTAWE
jgi:hypothetical protein